MGATNVRVMQALQLPVQAAERSCLQSGGL